MVGRLPCRLAKLLALVGIAMAQACQGDAPVDGAEDGSLDDAPPSVDWAAPWSMHTIDDSASGADGVKTADVNGDGLLDLAVGWEESGIVKLYENPGPEAADSPWPDVVTNRAASVEGVALGDLDQDGSTDVISCTG